MTIQDFKQTFVPYLNTAIEDKFDHYSAHTQDEGILDMIQYTKQIIGGGKCIRPYMAYLMYQSLEGKDLTRVMDSLVSLEIFHSFALVHDDIIDKGLTRHGKQTVHTYVEARLKAQKRWSQDYTHVGNGQAILVGDLLFAWSLERFVSFGDLPNHSDAWRYFMQMIDEVVVGQMIDVDIMTRDRVDMNLIESKMLLKTAGYTFVRPMQIGVALAGKSQEMEQFCLDFGRSLGLAFQTQDDILDLVADPGKIQKSVLSDIREHQHTYLTQYVFENGTKEDIRDLTAVWGSEIRPTDQASIIGLFQRTGALAFAQDKVREYLNQSRTLVEENTHLSDTGKQSLLFLVDYIANRSV